MAKRTTRSRRLLKDTAALFPKSSKTLKKVVHKTTKKLSSFLSSSLKMANDATSKVLRRVKKIVA